MTADEPRNSLVPINLLPLDILLLIPTHLASLSDRLRVTFVCRHWRQAFVQHAPLWSQLYLTEKTDRHLLTTLLERAKQSPLDITLHCSKSSIHDVTLLSPFAQQIRNLTVEDAFQGEIQKISVTISDALPLLHTLSIRESGIIYDSPFVPALSLFEGAVNVKKFVLRMYSASLLSHFAIKNLTTFHHSGRCRIYPVPLLLDFLEASPSLQEINIAIMGGISNEGIPPDRVLVLPCVKFCYLTLPNNTDGWELATHLSCPSAERAVFRTQPDYYDSKIPEDIYPSSLQWNAIARQYMMGMTRGVELKLKVDDDDDLTCIVALWSPNEAAIGLCCRHPIKRSENGNETLTKKVGSNAFSRASQTILNYLLLANITTLYIQDNGLLAGDLELAANDIGMLLGSMGPLEKLYLDRCDLRPYLDPFLKTPLFPNAIQPTLFPPIEKFRITGPIQSLSDKKYAAAVVKLAESQHARGVPFKHVTLRPSVPSWVVKQLSLSVNTVVCGKFLPSRDGDHN